MRPLSDTPKALNVLTAGEPAVTQPVAYRPRHRRFRRRR